MRLLDLVLYLTTLLDNSSLGDNKGKEDIEQVAYAIADPKSPKFRQYLSAPQAATLARQHPAIPRRAVSYPEPKTWPEDTSTSRAKQVSAREPSDLRKRTSCGARDLVSPTCIRQAYGIDYTPQPNRTTFAVYATEAASFKPADLQVFLKAYRPKAAGSVYEVVGKGDSANGSPGLESNIETALDTQTLLGTAYPAKGILYNLGGVFGPDPGMPYPPFVNFLNDLIHNDTVPSVVSFSESMPENRMDPDYARTLCTMMALAGARGVSLLFSSGDNGPNGDQATGKHKTVFEPEFPASCPFVTAVGGTTNLANETAATRSTIPAINIGYYASGGGFSNLFARPTYQNATVPGYIAAHVPENYQSISGFNASGRGTPDVSAFSTNFPVVYDRLTLPVGGTSASTPLWAAVVVLLNDYEASKGRPPLGFLNPWIYSLGDGALNGTALYDITTGGNSVGGCIAISGCDLKKVVGYNVSQGWDPVTGLGSPRWEGLVQALG